MVLHSINIVINSYNSIIYEFKVTVKDEIIT